MKNRISLKLNANRISTIIFRVALYLLLFDLAYVFLYPVFYMVITSLKSPADILDSSVTWLINSFHWENYSSVWTILDYPTHFLKTVIIVVICTLGHIISCSYIGYGFARYDFIGKKFLFVLLLLSIIIPPQTIIIPLYMVISGLDFSSGILPIILPTWLGFGLKGGLFIFIFRQFYLSLPPSLEEAASIDGCGPIKTFFKIAFPSSRSSVVVCLVLSIVWHWNDYFEPSIYLTQRENYLLPMLLPDLMSMVEKAGGGEEMMGAVLETSNLYTEGLVMAATFIIILPVFLMYTFLQKQFMQGIETSGLTGE